MADLGEQFNAQEWANEFISAIDELRARNQWVAWKYVRKPGAKKPDKLPVNPKTGALASHSNPDTWGSFIEARDRKTKDNLAGVGFCLGWEDDLTGVDLDSCRDPETGEIEPWAQKILDLAETYAEVSPSGGGIRLFARGKVSRSVKSDKARVEIYGQQRFLTITGQHIAETPLDIREAPKTIEWLAALIEAVKSEAERERERKLKEHVHIKTPESATFTRSTSARERAWAEKALEGVHADLSGTLEGGRNHALNAASYRMGRMVARGWIAESEVRCALEDACKRNGLWKEGPTGVRATLASGLRGGMASPHEDLPERDNPDDEEALRVGEQIVESLLRRSDGTLYDKETGEIFEEGHANDYARSDSECREKARSKDNAPGAKRDDVEIVIASSLAGKDVPEMEWGSKD